jgi:hypothetical protein
VQLHLSPEDSGGGARCLGPRDRPLEEDDIDPPLRESECGRAPHDPAADYRDLHAECLAGPENSQGEREIRRNNLESPDLPLSL